MDLKKHIRQIPDYPKKGINFIDITTMVKNPDVFEYLVNSISSHFSQKGITKVVSLESRGFIAGGAIAYKLNAGFIPVRKKGKLPGETISESYELEYGVDVIEMHTDALNENDVVLIHDDLLATGGTAMAALTMLKKLNINKIFLSFIVDLSFIDTQKKKDILNYPNHIMVIY